MDIDVSDSGTKYNMSDTAVATTDLMHILLNTTVSNATIYNDTVTAAVESEGAHAGYRMSSTCSGGVEYYRWFSNVVIASPLVTFGVVGNILSFIVLCLQKPYLTTTILLRYLAVIDMLILLAVIPLRILRYIQYCHGVMDDYHDIYALYIHRWGYPCLYAFRMAGTWITTFLTVDRHIAVCKPLHAQRIVTKDLAIGQIIGVTVGSILLSLPNFFESKIVEQDGLKVYSYRDFARSVSYIMGYKILFTFLMMYIIPIAIMIIFNVRLARNLRLAAKDRASLQRSVSSDSARLNNSITTIVIAVVVTFVVCNIIPLISQSIYLLGYCFPSIASQLLMPRRYMSITSDIFVTLNSAVNFLIYCVCSRGFRSTFLRVFKCRIDGNISRKNQGRHSNGSANTYFSLFSHSSNKKQNGGSKESSHYLLSKETSNNHKHESAFHIYG